MAPAGRRTRPARRHPAVAARVGCGGAGRLDRHRRGVPALAGRRAGGDRRAGRPRGPRLGRRARAERGDDPAGPAAHLGVRPAGLLRPRLRLAPARPGLADARGRARRPSPRWSTTRRRGSTTWSRAGWPGRSASRWRGATTRRWPAASWASTATRRSRRWPASARTCPAAAARPGLAVLATDDRNVGTDEMRRRAAARAGARGRRARRTRPLVDGAGPEAGSGRCSTTSGRRTAADRTERQGPGPAKPPLTWALIYGADDGNRTRVFSLGS